MFSTLTLFAKQLFNIILASIKSLYHQTWRSLLFKMKVIDLNESYIFIFKDKILMNAPELLCCAYIS
jgi:hypothetical protein